MCTCVCASRMRDSVCRCVCRGRATRRAFSFGLCAHTHTYIYVCKYMLGIRVCILHLKYNHMHTNIIRCIHWQNTYTQYTHTQLQLRGVIVWLFWSNGNQFVFVFCTLNRTPFRCRHMRCYWKKFRTDLSKCTWVFILCFLFFAKANLVEPRHENICVHILQRKYIHICCCCCCIRTY